MSTCSLPTLVVTWKEPWSAWSRLNPKNARRHHPLLRPAPPSQNWTGVDITARFGQGVVVFFLVKPNKSKIHLILDARRSQPPIHDPTRESTCSHLKGCRWENRDTWWLHRNRASRAPSLARCVGNDQATAAELHIMGCCGVVWQWDSRGRFFVANARPRRDSLNTHHCCSAIAIALVIQVKRNADSQQSGLDCLRNACVDTTTQQCCGPQRVRKTRASFVSSFCANQTGRCLGYRGDLDRQQRRRVV